MATAATRILASPFVLAACRISDRLVWAGSGIWGPVIAAAVLHAALLGAYVAAHGGDIAVLVCVGTGRQGDFPYEDIQRGFGTVGYDGQFYYALARSPWEKHSYGIDHPAARHLRILYPALGWLCSGGGNVHLLLWVLPALNLAAIIALTGWGAWFAGRSGLNPWWGLLLPFACNVGFAALRNLTDPLAALATFGLLAAWSTRASGWLLTLCAAAALLSREPSLAVVLVVLGAAVCGRRWAAVAGLSSALMLWVAWVLVLHTTYGAWPFLPGSGNFAGPLEGLLYRWSRIQSTAHSMQSFLFQGMELLVVVGAMGLALYLAWASREGVLRAFLILAVLLAVVAGRVIYCDEWSYARVLLWLPLGIWMASVRLGKTWPLWLLVPGSLWVFLVVKWALAG